MLSMLLITSQLQQKFPRRRHFCRFISFNLRLGQTIILCKQFKRRVLPTRRLASAILAIALCLSVSVMWSSIETAERIGLDSGTGSFVDLSCSVLLGNFGTSKIWALPSGVLSQIPDLEISPRPVDRRNESSTQLDKGRRSVR